MNAMNIKRILASFSLFIWPLFIYASEPDKNYEVDSFSESFSDNVNVSGSILVSYLVSGEFDLASPDKLYVFFTPEHPILNVYVVSIDGKYSADATFKINQSETGWIAIALPSKHIQKLKKYKATDLVAYAFADSKDKRGKYVQEVFPVSWGQPNFKSFSFVINSDGFTPNYTFVNSNDELETIKCEYLNSSTSRAFNHTCQLSPDLLGKKSTVTFSPDEESSGKKYFIWSGDGRK